MWVWPLLMGIHANVWEIQHILFCSFYLFIFFKCQEIDNINVVCG